MITIEHVRKLSAKPKTVESSEFARFVETLPELFCKTAFAPVFHSLQNLGIGEATVEQLQHGPKKSKQHNIVEMKLSDFIQAVEGGPERGSHEEGGIRLALESHFMEESIRDQGASQGRFGSPRHPSSEEEQEGHGQGAGHDQAGQEYVQGYGEPQAKGYSPLAYGYQGARFAGQQQYAERPEDPREAQEPEEGLGQQERYQQAHYPPYEQHKGPKHNMAMAPSQYYYPPMYSPHMPPGQYNQAPPAYPGTYWGPPHPNSYPGPKPRDLPQGYPDVYPEQEIPKPKPFRSDPRKEVDHKPESPKKSSNFQNEGIEFGTAPLKNEGIPSYHPGPKQPPLPYYSPSPLPSGPSPYPPQPVHLPPQYSDYPDPRLYPPVSRPYPAYPLHHPPPRIDHWYPQHPMGYPAYPPPREHYDPRTVEGYNIEEHTGERDVVETNELPVQAQAPPKKRTREPILSQANQHPQYEPPKRSNPNMAQQLSAYPGPAHPRDPPNQQTQPERRAPVRPQGWDDPQTGYKQPPMPYPPMQARNAVYANQEPHQGNSQRVNRAPYDRYAEDPVPRAHPGEQRGRPERGRGGQPPHSHHPSQGRYPQNHEAYEGQPDYESEEQLNKIYAVDYNDNYYQPQSKHKKPQSRPNANPQANNMDIMDEDDNYYEESSRGGQGSGGNSFSKRGRQVFFVKK